MRILLAEDDSNISTIAVMALQGVGQHEVTLAQDGASALHMALNEEFDLILLDEMMPKMNGLKVAQNYHTQAQNPKPIIFLSAKSQATDIALFKSHGEGFIPKPFDPMQLCSLIEETLRIRGAA